MGLSLLGYIVVGVTMGEVVVGLPAQTRDFDLGVFIGRFEPPTEAHIHVMRRGLEVANFLLVIIGSAGAARNYYSVPFTETERQRVLEQCFDAEDRQRIFFVPLEDSNYLTSEWIEGVQLAAKQAAALTGKGQDSSITLVGHKKDTATSYYLRMFPEWAPTDVGNFKGLSATAFRNEYFSGDPTRVEGMLESCDEVLPSATLSFLREFRSTSTFNNLTADSLFDKDFLAPYESMPHRPTFVEVNSVLLHSGKVLLYRRPNRPGIGQWALPGGNLRADEYIEHALVRLLRQRTEIDLKDNTLANALRYVRVFDAPLRSPRGRVISHTGIFLLDPRPAANDLATLRRSISPPRIVSHAKREVRWVKLADLRRDEMYLDHYSMIRAVAATVQLKHT